MVHVFNLFSLSIKEHKVSLHVGPHDRSLEFTNILLGFIDSTLQYFSFKPIPD